MGPKQINAKSAASINSTSTIRFHLIFRLGMHVRKAIAAVQNIALNGKSIITCPHVPILVSPGAV